MNFEKLFLYKQWSDQRLFKAVDQINQVQYLEDYNFAKQQFNHMIIVEELFRSRLENKKALHTQTNTEFLPSLDELKHELLNHIYGLLNLSKIFHRINLLKLFIFNL